MRRSLQTVVGLFSLALLAGCLLPASERVELDRKVGRRDEAGWTVEVEDGLASVRALTTERVELWGQAPVLALTVAREGGPLPLRIDVLNCVPGAVLAFSGGTLASTRVDDRPASCRFDLPSIASETVRIGPPDAGERAPFAFAVLSDVQRAIGDVHEVFARINEDPTLRFVVSTGDLVNLGKRDELVRFQRELTALAVPLFSTVGNHEMGESPTVWHQLFGPFNVHFRFHGVAFSLVDSANATIDPHVYDRLDDWLDDAHDEVHVVLTHVPPLDPAGLRGGGFRSRKEGAKLMRRLADGRADALFLGHIHSYYAFSIAGVPTYISGGGGAVEERLDGIRRHYLRIEADPARRLESVAVVRVD